MLILCIDAQIRIFEAFKSWFIRIATSKLLAKNKNHLISVNIKYSIENGCVDFLKNWFIWNQLVPEHWLRQVIVNWNYVVQEKIKWLKWSFWIDTLTCSFGGLELGYPLKMPTALMQCLLPLLSGWCCKWPTVVWRATHWSQVQLCWPCNWTNWSRHHGSLHSGYIWNTWKSMATPELYSSGHQGIRNYLV